MLTIMNDPWRLVKVSTNAVASELGTNRIRIFFLGAFYGRLVDSIVDSLADELERVSRTTS
jgi:hypothetical protein